MTSFEEILRRRRQRQPMDETLPDGTPAMEVGMRTRIGGMVDRMRGIPSVANWDVNAGEGQALLTPRNRDAITRSRRVVSDPRDPATFQVPPGYGRPQWESWDRPNEYGDTGEYISYPNAAPNQGSITRPQVNTLRKPGTTTWDTGQQATEVPMPEPAMADPDAGRMGTVSFNPATGRPNEDYYRERDDPRGLYNAYQNWRPHGGRRGFKNALKAGALAAARVAQSTDNPAAILSAFGIGSVGGAVKPDFKNKLVRGFKLDQIGKELGDELKLQKDQAAIDAAQMVPVTLDNGQTVMVPAKTAGTLQSRQQEIDLRGNTLEARKKRWNQLGEHEAARDAQALYNSGAADDSAELRAEIARRLRLPAGTVLPPRGLGNQIKVDDLGNYVVISPRSGEVTDTGRGSFSKTQEQGRGTRQRRALEAAKERVEMQQSGANQRAGMRAGSATKVAPETQREIAKGVGSLEAVKNELSEIDARIKQIDEAAKGRQQTPDEVQRLTVLGRQRQQKVNEAKAISAQLDSLDPNNETGVGEGGYPYRKPRAQQASDLDNSIYPNSKGQSSGRKWSASKWAAANPGGDVGAARAAAKAAGYTVVE